MEGELYFAVWARGERRSGRVDLAIGDAQPKHFGVERSCLNGKSASADFRGQVTGGLARAGGIPTDDFCDRVAGLAQCGRKECCQTTGTDNRD